MRRLTLELRRLRGGVAWLLIVKTPLGLHWDRIGIRRLLSWAGLYAHWDSDRENWSHP